MGSTLLLLSLLMATVCSQETDLQTVVSDNIIDENFGNVSTQNASFSDTIFSEDMLEDLTEPDNEDEHEDQESTNPCEKYLSFIDSYNARPSDCKGFHFGNNGTIMSKGYPKSAPKDSKCLWIICGYPNQLIRLVWYSAKFNERAQNKLKVYDEIVPGSSIGETLKRDPYMYINKRPTAFAKTFISPTVAIVFDSNEPVYKRFKAEFWILDKEPDCKQEYVGSNGIIKTPNYPNTHISTFPCVWIIRSPHGTKIEVNLTEFAVVVPECEDGYIEIRNGDMPTSAIIDRICGRKPYENICSSDSNVMRIAYFTGIPNTGFRLPWNSTHKGCGGTRTESSGVVESPHYYGPLNRSMSDVDCTWKIQVNEGSTIKLDFIDIFQLNTVWNKCGCSFLMILDGIEDDSKQLAKVCENEYHNSLYSSTNKASIKFVVRGAESMGKCKDQNSLFRNIGFAIKYRADTSRVLGGFDGVIESLDYPRKYPENLNVTWIIEASPGNSIDLNFSNISLESGKDGSCSWDYVEIAEWDRRDKHKNKFTIGKYCTSNITNLIPRSDTLAVTFVTDNSNYEKGFRLAWKEKGCIQTIDLIDQTIHNISTPRHPAKYASSRICRWRLRASTGHRLQLSLDEAEIEWEPNCKYDSLRVHDGPNELAPKIFEFCGKLESSIVLTSSSESFFLKFESDTTIEYKGFAGTVKQIYNIECEHEYRSNSGYIYLKSTSGQSNHYMNCTWNILVDAFSTIQFEVIGNKVLKKETCQGVTFQVFDGEKLLIPRCLYMLDQGRKTFESSGNHLRIKVVRNGKQKLDDYLFAIKYTRICGSVISADVGILTTPAIMKGTGEVINCNWRIIAPSPEKKIVVLFTRIDWAVGEASGTNHSVHVSVTRNSSDHPTIYEDCCGPIPEPLHSLSGDLTLKVVGNLYIEALFAQIPSECSLTYFNVMDYLTNQNITLLNDCVSYIETDNGSAISLITMTYNPEKHKIKCQSGFVEVYVGNFFGQLENVYCLMDIPIKVDEAGPRYWVVYIRANMDDVVVNFPRTKVTTGGGSSNQKAISFSTTFKITFVSFLYLNF